MGRGSVRVGIDPVPLRLLLRVRALTLQIVGGENVESRVQYDQQQILVNHVKRLRALPHLANAFFVFVPESNLAFEAQAFSHALRNEGVVSDGNFVIKKEDMNREGIRTDNTSKLAMASMFQRYLENPRYGSVRFHRDFFTLGKHQDGRDSEVRALRIAIIDQLKAWKRIVIPPNNPLREPTITFSGKYLGGADDLSIATQLAVYMSMRFMNEETYAEYRR